MSKVCITIKQSYSAMWTLIMIVFFMFTLSELSKKISIYGLFMNAVYQLTYVLSKMTKAIVCMNRLFILICSICYITFFLEK